MMRHRLRRRYGRRRFGRAMGPQLITRPAGLGMVDVVLVDAKGRTLRTHRRGVSYATAVRIIRGGG
jgi:hypothetical protein